MAVAQDHWAAKWVEASKGQIPPNAFWEGGHAIGRGKFNDGLHVGYVKNDCGLVIGWGGEEHILENYEVLTGDKSHFQWVSCKGAFRPQDVIPLKGGYEADGKELYIARVNYKGEDGTGKGEDIIGKAGQHLIDGMNFAINGHEISKPEYYTFVFRT